MAGVTDGNAGLAAELARRDRLLGGLAETTMSLLELRQDERVAMERVLGILGRAAGVDRAYVFENDADPQTGALRMSMRHEWVSQGTMPTLNDPKMQNLQYSEWTGWYETLSQRRPLHLISRELTGVMRTILDEQAVLALLAVPIFVEERFWGFVGLDDCRSERPWASAEVDALRVFADSIGTIMVRRRLEAQITVMSMAAVQIWERMLLVPLHGTLDGGRMAMLTQILLDAVHSHGATHVLLDFTGLAYPASELVALLQRLVSAIRLLGARCVLVGLSAHAAASFADSLQHDAVCATLQSGLALAFAERGLAVVPKA